MKSEKVRTIDENKGEADNPLVCEPWEDRGVDFVTRYPKTGNNQGNTYIRTLPNTPLWSEEEYSWLNVCGKYTLEQAFGQGQLPKDITIRELCAIRLGREKYERMSKESREKLSNRLCSAIYNGHVTVKGGGADTGIAVLRGGLPNA